MRGGSQRRKGGTANLIFEQRPPKLSMISLSEEGVKNDVNRLIVKVLPLNSQ